MTTMRDDSLVIPEAANIVEQMKIDIAKELGLWDKIEKEGWESLTTKEVGLIGGNMTKRQIAIAQQVMRQQNDFSLGNNIPLDLTSIKTKQTVPHVEH